jgi:hypothetical protein
MGLDLFNNLGLRILIYSPYSHVQLMVFLAMDPERTMLFTSMALFTKFEVEPQSLSLIVADRYDPQSCSGNDLLASER